MSCHSLKDDGIGPPLGGVTTLLSQQDLIDFIKNPSVQIESKEERALFLQARYKQVMPAFGWMKEEEINSILSYIHQQTQLNHLEAFSVNKDTSNSGCLILFEPPSPYPKYNKPNSGFFLLRPGIKLTSWQP